MDLDKFFEIIENEQTDYIVRLAYKFEFEKDYDISNEILEWDSDGYVWVNDWYEGQTDVYVIGFIKVSDVVVPDWKGVL